MIKNISEASNIIDRIDENTYELNIQPPASILNVFSRLSYKPWYAIAEFVDNSTQSYLSNMTMLQTAPNFNKLIIKIEYNENKNTLTITDNAFGMEIERFKDAMLLDAKNSGQQGRNEFGMGLKTAASWFGNVWTIMSSQYGSENEYTATVNIPLLQTKGYNIVDIHRKTVDSLLHGTTIIISEVTKKITASRTKGKIVDLLSSMYRRDINSGNVEIWFNGDTISFDNYPVLKNFRGKEWKKPLEFTVPFDGKNHLVTGFVAIMDPGSFLKAGFALFRQGRVVIGGTDLNYKPQQIFGQSQSQRSLKLFGELDMNDFPVNQAKDGFVWDDGLEEVFIDILKNNIQEYIKIAELSIKERANELQYSDEKSDNVEKEVSSSIQNIITGFETAHMNLNHPANIPEEETDAKEYVETILNASALAENKLVGKNRIYEIPINPIMKKSFNVTWAIGKKDFWIDYNEDNGTINVKINIDHPFFKPYSNEEEFKTVLEKFVLAFIAAEEKAKVASDKDGYIVASSMKHHMNDFLSKMGE